MRLYNIAFIVFFLFLDNKSTLNQDLSFILWNHLLLPDWDNMCELRLLFNMCSNKYKSVSILIVVYLLISFTILVLSSSAAPSLKDRDAIAKLFLWRINAKLKTYRMLCNENKMSESSTVNIVGLEEKSTNKNAFQ